MDERAARVLGSGVVNSDLISKIDVRENPNSREATAILGRALRDRSRRFRENMRKERRQAKKEGRRFDARDKKLAPLGYYWLEPHQLRPQPGGNSKLAQQISKTCTVS